MDKIINELGNEEGADKLKKFGFRRVSKGWVCKYCVSFGHRKSCERVKDTWSRYFKYHLKVTDTRLETRFVYIIKANEADPKGVEIREKADSDDSESESEPESEAEAEAETEAESESEPDPPLHSVHF